MTVTHNRHKGWLLTHYAPPIPCRKYDWVAVHPVYDEDRPNADLLLEAATRDELIAAIDAWHGDGQRADDIAVDRFAAKMRAKMAESRTKGREGWDDPTRCSPDTLVRLLYAHAEKGDPVDVANYCMMLDHYGATTALPPANPTAPPKCKHCDDTGYYDYAGLLMDECQHCKSA